MPSVSDGVVNTRKCTKCNLVKDLELFHKYPQNKIGRASICKDCAKLKARVYYHKNIDRVHAYRKREYIKHRIKLLEKADKWKKKTVDSWREHLPNKTKCEICGVELFYGSSNKLKAIHFDHRNGGKEIIKVAPNHWLRRHPKNPERTKIWDSCKFGMLCNDCNRKLPTDNRKEWFKMAYKYVFGKEMPL